MSGKHWTLEEKEFLFDSWGEKSIKRIAKHLNRTEKAVLSFAERHKLGGTMIRNDYYLTTVQASEITGISQSKILRLIYKNELKCKKRTLRERRIYRIDPVELEKFLRDNQDKWDANKLEFGFFNENEKWLREKRLNDAKNTRKERINPWSIKEEETLIKLVREGHSNGQIAIILNRTRPSVNRKRNTLVESGRLERGRVLHKRSA